MRQLGVRMPNAHVPCFSVNTFRIELNSTWRSDNRINIGPTVKGYEYFCPIFS